VDLSTCDVCDDYCDIYDVCEDYYHIYDACDEYIWNAYYSSDFWVFLNVKNKKIAMATLWQSDQNQQQKQCLCRAFIGAHGKGAIDCRAF
jgi:hypothetical protein